MQNNLSHPYDPKRPWDTVWSDVCANAAWWQQNLIQPCLITAAGAATQATFLTGEAPVAPSPLSSSAHGTKRTRPVKQHEVRDGGFVVNRRGVPLCMAFQEGSCSGGG
eukprot:1072619-Amphidinium_carterae.1